MRLASRLTAAAQPFKSHTWCAALAVVTDRCDGDPARLRRLGRVRFAAAVRREIPRWQAQRPCGRIVDAVFAALSASTGVIVQRRGTLERVGLVLADWCDIKDGSPTPRFGWSMSSTSST